MYIIGLSLGLQASSFYVVKYDHEQKTKETIDK